MKTNTKKNTRSTANACKRQAAADTKKLKKYEVRLSWTQESEAKAIIEAASQAKADALADAIESEDIDDWNPINGQLYVSSVDLLEGGQDDE